MVAKICKWLQIMIMVVLVILVFLLVLPMALKIKTLVVLSPSMEPTMPVGSLVYVREVPSEKINQNDVITFTLSNGQYATHRVIEVNREENSFRTKGDNNDIPDEAPIPYGSIQGKVIWHLPWLGFLVTSIQSREVIPILAGIVVFLIIITFLPEIFVKPVEDESATEAADEKSIKAVKKKNLTNKTKRVSSKGNVESMNFTPFVPYSPEMLEGYRRRDREEPRDYRRASDEDEREGYRRRDREEPRDYRRASDEDEREGYRRRDREEPRDYRRAADEDDREIYHRRDREEPRDYRRASDEDGREDYRRRDREEPRDNRCASDEDDQEGYRRRDREEPRDYRRASDEDGREIYRRRDREEPRDYRRSSGAGDEEKSGGRVKYINFTPSEDRGDTSDSDNFKGFNFQSDGK